jgi:predicted translin family RNA/ssDNA-binding protein
MLLCLSGAKLAARVPVPDHLESQNHIEGETSKESVENNRVVNLSQGSKDTSERTKEVVEDLAQNISIPTRPKGIIQNLQQKQKAVQYSSPSRLSKSEEPCS